MIADLHCHTTYSDGLFTAEELILMALKRGLRYLAISDHDHLGAIPEAVERAKGTPLEIIPAVEINTDWHNDEVHVLGYFIDPANEALQTALSNQRKSRDLRIEAMVEKLQGLGIDINMAKVRSKGKGTLGRPHIAFALVELGLASDVKDAFQKYIVRGAPAYIPRRKDAMDPVEAIRAIKKAGGVAVMAHPGVVKDYTAVIDALIPEGLEGLEVYHPQHKPMTSAYLLELAKKKNLLVTGGSDFHGDSLGPSHTLGMEDVKEFHIKALREKAARPSP